jgi:hypothetical protein
MNMLCILLTIVSAFTNCRSNRFLIFTKFSNFQHNVVIVEIGSDAVKRGYVPVCAWTLTTTDLVTTVTALLFTLLIAGCYYF